jgi:dihydrofolate reductase
LAATPPSRLSAPLLSVDSADLRLFLLLDACLLGGGMYPGYEKYWTSIQNEPAKPVWSGPTPAEIE